MEIKIIKVGPIECNCYLLKKDNKVLIIDPGDEPEKIIKNIQEEVVGTIITHHHFDHIGALSEIIEKYKVKSYDKNNLKEGLNKIDNFEFEVIYTPGHKEDLITIYFKEENIMFCGDFIFKDSIGRCDLPGSNIEEMIKSINKIKQYDKKIIIYPGHGPSTNLEYETKNNQYFK